MEASWGRLEGLLGAFWKVLGGVLAVFFGSWRQNWSTTSSWTGSVFRDGPSWRRLGVVFLVFGGRFGIDFEAS